MLPRVICQPHPSGRDNQRLRLGGDNMGGDNSRYDGQSSGTSRSQSPPPVYQYESPELTPPRTDLLYRINERNFLDNDPDYHTFHDGGRSEGPEPIVRFASPPPGYRHIYETNDGRHTLRIIPQDYISDSDEEGPPQDAYRHVYTFNQQEYNQLTYATQNWESLIWPPPPSPRRSQHGEASTSIQPDANVEPGPLRSLRNVQRSRGTHPGRHSGQRGRARIGNVSSPISTSDPVMVLQRQHDALTNRLHHLNLINRNEVPDDTITRYNLLLERAQRDADNDGQMQASNYASSSSAGATRSSQEGMPSRYSQIQRDTEREGLEARIRRTSALLANLGVSVDEDANQEEAQEEEENAADPRHQEPQGSPEYGVAFNIYFGPR